MGEFVNLEIDKTTGVGTIRLDRPPMNAINDDVVRELEVAAREATHNDDVRAVVVTGGEKIFAAGADIKQMVTRTPQQMMNYMAGLQAVFTELEEIPKVVIAAINGFALGGGCELSLACDFRVMGDNGHIGQPEILLGIIPGAGGTQRLPRLVGRGRALELLLTGDPVDAQEALRIGLVNRVVKKEALIDEARAMARKMAAAGPLAVRRTLAAVDEGLDRSLDLGLTGEAELFGECFRTRDMKEGTSAFLEKRPPKFTGQ